MSEEGEKIGYGHPPAHTRFKKGQSGNPRGRPRKIERSLTMRQVRRDVLSLCEMEIPVNTPQGRVELPVIKAIFQQLVSKALSGNGPCMRFVFREYRDAIIEHNKAHEAEFQMLEQMERMAVIDQTFEQNEFVRMSLRDQRRASRKV